MKAVLSHFMKTTVDPRKMALLTLLKGVTAKKKL